MISEGPSFPWSQEDLKKLLLNPRLSDPAMLDLLRTLGQTFTTKRDLLQDYGKSRDLVSAYTYFYLPTNFAKFDYLMRQIPPAVALDMLSSHFVDIGSGPGTFSLAYLTLMKARLKRGSGQKLVLLDQSSLMLDQAKTLIESLLKSGGQVTPHFLQRDFLQLSHSFLGPKAPLTLCFGHSLNEMEVGAAIKKITELDPTYVMLIEPGTKESFQKVRQLRGQLRPHYQILFPCPVTDAPCALEDESGQALPTPHWCHQVMKISLPPLLQQMADKLRINRQILPMIVHFYVKKSHFLIHFQGHQQGLSSILLQYKGETKYSFPLVICQEEQGRNVPLEGELLKRDFSVAEKKQIKELMLGDKVPITLNKERPQSGRVLFRLNDHFFKQKTREGKSGHDDAQEEN